MCLRLNDLWFDCVFFLQQIAEPYYSRIRNEAYKLLKQCEEGFEHSRDEHDYSVYTGSGGMVTFQSEHNVRQFQLVLSTELIM